MTLSFDPRNTFRGRVLRCLHWTVGAIAALTAVVVVWILWPIFPRTCSPGVDRIDGECIGVTDDHSFYPGDDARKDPLNKVREAIKAENEWVARQHRPTVTIAFLGPLTDLPGGNSLTGGRLPHEVEGAYIAQYRADHHPVFGSVPLIRLVLANEGTNERHWAEVVSRFEKMTKDPKAPLSAVIGLGLSQKETADAARELSAHQIPMVGDVITADGMDATGTVGKGGRIEWLTRVVPSTGRQIEAIAAYLRRYRHDLRSAIMVTDTNAGDIYNNALRRDFEHYMGDYWARTGKLDEIFNGAAGDNAYDPDLIRIVQDFCGDKRPDMVFFAGRANALDLFIRDFQSNATIKGNACRARPLTIVTGSDATVLTLTGGRNKPAGRTAGSAHLTVLYTPLADLSTLSHTAAYQAFLKDFTTDGPDKTAFPGQDLGDGWAISSHDAMMTAVTAVRDSRHWPPDRNHMLSALRHMQSGSGVNGAVDVVHLDRDGNPIGKELHVMQIER